MNADHTLLLELFDQALHAKDKTIMEKYDMVLVFRNVLARIATPPPAPPAQNAVWVVMDKYGYRTYAWSAKDALKITDGNSNFVAVVLHTKEYNTIAFTSADNWAELRKRANSETK
jgi:hypothetical protein